MTNKERQAKLQYLLNSLSMTKEQKDIVVDLVNDETNKQNVSNDEVQSINIIYQTNSNGIYAAIIDDVLFSEADGDNDEMSSIIKRIFKLDELITFKNEWYVPDEYIIKHFNKIIPNLLINRTTVDYGFVAKEYEWSSSMNYSILIYGKDSKHFPYSIRFVFETNFSSFRVFVVSENKETLITNNWVSLYN